MSLLLLLVLVAALAPILAQPGIRKALRGLLGDRRELALFVLFEVVAIGAVALLLMAVGPRTGGIVLIAAVGLLALWVVMKPPAQKR